MERIIISGNSRRAYLGLIFGFIISILVIGGGIYLINVGYQWAGVVLIGLNLTGLAGVFVYGTKFRRDLDRNTEHDTG